MFISEPLSFVKTYINEIDSALKAYDPNPPFDSRRYTKTGNPRQ